MHVGIVEAGTDKGTFQIDCILVGNFGFVVQDSYKMASLHFKSDGKAIACIDFRVVIDLFHIVYRPVTYIIYLTI